MISKLVHVVRTPRPWWVWVTGIALLALLALFPLRIALAMSDLQRVGFTARQVAGTIWYGRIGDLQLRSQPLGTMEVRLNPLALLVGRVSMRFNRMDDPQGGLNGRLLSGGMQGVESVSGRIDVSQIFAPLPLEALELEEVTVLFRNGQCVDGSGRVTPVMSVPIPGLTAGRLAGTLQCEGQRARVTMTSGSGAERIEFYVNASGRYRGWVSVRNAVPEVASALSLLGFRPSPEGLTMSVEGRL